MASSLVTAESIEPPSFAGRPGIADEEKRERIYQLPPAVPPSFGRIHLKRIRKTAFGKIFHGNTHMTGIYKKSGVRSRAELIINYRNINREPAQTP